MATIRDRIKEFRRVRAGDLHPAPKAWRKHPTDQQRRLRAVLDEVGWAAALVARERQDGELEIIDGHLRAELDPEALVPVLVLEVSRDEAKLLLGLMHPLAEMAEIDYDLLGSLLEEIRARSVGVRELVDAMSARVRDVVGQNNEVVNDPAPEPPESTAIQPGDVWRLGKHRLLCGDATNADDVARLVGKHTAAMAFIDPPYNVSYVGKTKDALTFQNDGMPTEQYFVFIAAACKALFDHVRAGGACYVCHGDSEGATVRMAYVQAGWLLKQILVWVKHPFSPSRQDYHWAHEPILYGWKPGAAHHWFGGGRRSTVIDDGTPVSFANDDQGRVLVQLFDGGRRVVLRAESVELVDTVDESIETVWRLPKPRANRDHPTIKPVGIPARAIKNSSEPGDVVLDTFGGSGSTMSACEQLGRRCFATELDPKYCDVIVRRWQALSGKAAVRQADGVRFDDLVQAA